MEPTAMLIYWFLMWCHKRSPILRIVLPFLLHVILKIYFAFLLHATRILLEWFAMLFLFYQFVSLKASLPISVTGVVTWRPTIDDVVTSETNMTLTVIATDSIGAESILTVNIKLCPCANGTCMYNESLVGSENYEVKIAWTKVKWKLFQQILAFVVPPN